MIVLIAFAILLAASSTAFGDDGGGSDVYRPLLPFVDPFLF